MLDKDLIDEINVWEPEAAVNKAFQVVTQWLAKQINLLIKRKRIYIPDKNPGAVFGEDPRVIFVKMICRVEYYSANCNIGRICSARTKFNDSLNAAAAQNDQYIMNINCCTKCDDFDVCGNLSYSG